MDIGAYAQIDELEKVLEENNIVIPRLRGLRLMEKEKPVSDEELKALLVNAEFDGVEEACRSEFEWNSITALYSDKTDYWVNHFIEHEVDENGYPVPTKIRWDRIHGNKRKLIKYLIKRNKRELIKQFKVFNEYCGQKDILYIHCRLGGDNWNYYHCDEIIKKQSWYVNHCYDAYDGTYADVYAKINVK